MTSPLLLSSAIPWSPTIDDTIHSRLEESERSREWWKHRVSVLDLRCRDINAQLRDTLAENQRFRPLRIRSNCRLKEENERLAAELHVYRMRMLAKQTLHKVDSNTPPPTPDSTPHQTPSIVHHRPSSSPSPPQTPTTPRSPTLVTRILSPSRWSPPR
jgi:hypothetical protein